jgi:hypothetical protein
MLCWHDRTRPILVRSPMPHRSDREWQTIEWARGSGTTSALARGKLGPPARSVLGEQLLATLRDSLIEQLAGINLPDDAAAWAHRNISRQEQSDGRRCENHRGTVSCEARHDK